jgi:hypothetical protein
MSFSFIRCRSPRARTVTTFRESMCIRTTYSSSCMHPRSAQAAMCTIWSWTSSLARTSWSPCTAAEPKGPVGGGAARDGCGGGPDGQRPAAPYWMSGPPGDRLMFVRRSVASGGPARGNRRRKSWRGTRGRSAPERVVSWFGRTALSRRATFPTDLAQRSNSSRSTSPASISTEAPGPGLRKTPAKASAESREQRSPLAADRGAPRGCMAYGD